MTDFQTDQAVEYIKGRADTSKPFCLLLSISPPHDPHDLPDYREHLYDEAEKQIKELPPNVPQRVSEQARQRSIRYHANVMGIDDALGKVLAAINEQGLDENTIVVLTADHGECCLSHGIIEKNQFYEEAAAIPFIVRWPGLVESNQVVSDFLNITDIAPTLLDLCGVEIPLRMQGKSFAEFLTGQADNGPQDSAYLEINHPWYDYRCGQGPQGNRRCIVTDKWKLVLMESRVGTGGAVPWQLFEREKDPFEMNNLAEDPGCNLIICSLVHKMWEWMRETEDEDFFWQTMYKFREFRPAWDDMESVKNLDGKKWQKSYGIENETL